MDSQESNSVINMSLHQLLSDMRGSVRDQVEGDLNSVLVEVGAATVEGLGGCGGGSARSSNVEVPKFGVYRVGEVDAGEGTRVDGGGALVQQQVIAEQKQLW
jgi:hypothetical protein